MSDPFVLRAVTLGKRSSLPKSLAQVPPHSSLDCLIFADPGSELPSITEGMAEASSVSLPALTSLTGAFPPGLDRGLRGKLLVLMPIPLDRFC